MSILCRSLLSNPSSRIDYFISSSRAAPTFNTLNLSSIFRPKLISCTPYSSQLCSNRFGDSGYLGSFRSPQWQIKVSDSSGALFGNQEPAKFDFDALLAAVEAALLVVSVGCGVIWAFFRQHNLGLAAVAKRALVWLLTGAVVVGAAIRRRQWRRICGVSAVKSSTRGQSGNVIDRIEKLEENLRSATTIIRALSRHLEKLGIRFRVTRKSLKDPITETAALAQKNSEATRALAVQEDILEKELGEVQKVLLAMQDQQQKQLDLILAIAKNGKLLEPERESGEEEDHVHKSDQVKAEGSEQVDSPHSRFVSGQKGMSNDVS